MVFFAPSVVMAASKMIASAEFVVLIVVVVFTVVVSVIAVMVLASPGILFESGSLVVVSSWDGVNTIAVVAKCVSVVSKVLDMALVSSTEEPVLFSVFAVAIDTDDVVVHSC